MNATQTIYLIDGTAYIHRAYHAIRGLTNSKGLPTNAIFGFARMLLKLMEDYTPQFGAMCFDAKGPTFRHKIYQDYKANRPPMPDDMAVQIPYIKEVTAGFNLPIFEMSGYEADDLIGTLALMAVRAGFQVIMVTGDKDFMQLVNDNARIWDPMKDKIIDKQTINDSFGLVPQQMIDVMGLSGDASDNIPGVPGIGQKTAVGLIQNFGSLEDVYANIDQITRKKQKENLIQFKDQALLSRQLVTINCKVPLDFNPQSFELAPPNSDHLAGLFKDLEFRQLQRQFPQQADLSNKNYQLIDNSETLAKLIRRLEKVDLMALDTETTSLNPMAAQLVGISLAIEPHQAFYIPCGHTYDGIRKQLDADTLLHSLMPILTNPDIGKVGQNIKYDWLVLARHGVDLKGVVFDTMLASYLLNPSKRAHNLDQIALDFLDHKTISFKEVTDNGKINFDEVPIESALPYACEDADITLLAQTVLAPKLEELKLTKLFNDVEIPLVGVLMAMEMRGICVDQDQLRGLSRDFRQQLAQIETQVYRLAGEEFNLNSSQQLGHILFDKLKLPVQKKTRKKTAYSTDVDVLTALAPLHEIPALVLNHRTLAKLKSTYADALIGMVNPNTGRIHTSYNQTVTATGRLSSSDPNLQNIPIRTAEGRKIRKAFIPPENWWLLSADYSQVELRILAHYAKDDILIQAFRKDEDIHARTATEVFQVFPQMITNELRRHAKVINFGIIYGMSAYSLSKQLDISQKMAQTYINNYFDRYKGVKQFIDQTIADARQSQKTSTLLGRIRLLPDINSANHNVRRFAERIAVNTPIQGTAADLIKVAMIQMNHALKQRHFQSAMLLTVHDELVFEVPPNELEPMQHLVKEIMENVWDLEIPLKVNVKWGRNWDEAH